MQTHGMVKAMPFITLANTSTQLNATAEPLRLIQSTPMHGWFEKAQISCLLGDKYTGIESLKRALELNKDFAFKTKNTTCLKDLVNNA